jgi:predicted dehydrogenase
MSDAYVLVPGWGRPAERSKRESWNVERVRLGLIGMGLIGAAHATTLQKVEECDLVAVADVDEKHAETAAGLGVKYYRDYEEMIGRERLQGVIIATPNHLHATMGIACAERGLHLLVEKPITPNLADADRLIDAAKRNDVRILVGHQRRFNARVEKARDVVRGGELGKLVGATITWALLKPPQYFEGPFAWRKNRGGGPILINLIHEIDNLRYICGEIQEVFAVTSNNVRNFCIEDTAGVTFRFENGAVGTAFVSDCVPSLSAYEATTGENPLIPHDFGNCYHFFGTEASLLFPQMKTLFYADPTRRGWHFPITEQGLKVAKAEDPYVKEFRHFANVILGEEAPRISGEDGRRTLEVALAIQRSGETGQPVHLA